MNGNKVLVCGVTAIDVLVSGFDLDQTQPDMMSFVEDYRISSGGNACNVAINLAQKGMQVNFHGVVGNDTAGKIVEQALDKNNVNTQYLTRSNDVATGVSIVIVEKNGEKRLIEYLGTNSVFNPNTELYSGKLDLNYCVITGLGILPNVHTNISTIVSKLHENNICMVMDSSSAVGNLRDLFIAGDLVGVDYFLPNKREALKITGCQNVEDAANQLYKWGVKNVIVTCGYEGAFLRCHKEMEWFPASEAKAIDATGAGDAFLSEFVYTLSRGKKINKAIMRANIMAALCTTRVGATVDRSSESEAM